MRPRAAITPIRLVNNPHPQNRPNNGFLFPARGSAGTKSYCGWSKLKAGLDASVANWTFHDLRRTFATKLAELGVALHVIERLLNHMSGTVSGVAAIYNRHAYLSEMRDAVLKWERHLDSLLSLPVMPHRFEPFPTPTISAI
jgi:integrase